MISAVVSGEQPDQVHLARAAGNTGNVFFHGFQQ